MVNINCCLKLIPAWTTGSKYRVLVNLRYRWINILIKYTRFLWQVFYKTLLQETCKRLF